MFWAGNFQDEAEIPCTREEESYERLLELMSKELGSKLEEVSQTKNGLI